MLVAEEAVDILHSVMPPVKAAWEVVAVEDQHLLLLAQLELLILVAVVGVVLVGLDRVQQVVLA
jgi:hypothetical protein